MWWEIIPGFLVILAAVTIPHVITPLGNRFFLGNDYRRSLHTTFEQWNYLRDRRIDENTDPYKVHGLENIPDEEEEKRLKEERKKQLEEEENEKRRRKEAKEEEERKRLQEEEEKRQLEEDKKRGTQKGKTEGPQVVTKDDQKKSVEEPVDPCKPAEEQSAAAEKTAGDEKTASVDAEGKSETSGDESSQPCRRTPTERDKTKEYRLEDDDPCRK